MKCVECEINFNLYGAEQPFYKTNGLQEVDDLCSYHDELFKVEE